MPGTDLFDVHDDASADELRQRLFSLRSLIARAPVPIAVAHDPECRFISANSALATLLGLPDDSNISLTPPGGETPPYRIQRNGRDVPPAELPMQYAIAHRQRVSNEIEIVRGDGQRRYVQNDVEPVYDAAGNVYGCVSVCLDVTDRKLAEIALRDAARRKDEFLATLSHELRNPLAPMRTALAVMRLAPGDAVLAGQARETIERQLQHLVRITDDLLDVSRITQNKVSLRRERLDLRDVLRSAVEATRPLMDALAQTITIELPDAPAWVDGDPTRLSQVFSNVLNNASKYSDRRGAIRVSASTARSHATVIVADDGVGIPPEMLPRIFDMFTQLQEHRDRTYGGLGIGLTVARQLVELHGGTIEARSEGAGRGSQFVVELPLAKATVPIQAPRPATEAKGPPHVRVLVAEDNADAAEMMHVLLALKGHQVRVATDGAEAVELAREFEPHIAFLDIGMPRMDGYEAARRIRSIMGPRVVLVALTGWGQDDDKRRSREAGFDHHLTKPPEPDHLDRLIMQCADPPRTSGTP